jgi:hypothetical protein
MLAQRMADSVQYCDVSTVRGTHTFIHHVHIVFNSLLVALLPNDNDINPLPWTPDES